MIRRTFFLTISILAVIFLVGLSAQNTLQLGVTSNSCDAATATGNCTSFAVPARASQCTWQSSFGSAPASVTLQLQVSLDNSTYTTIDTSTSTTSESRTIVTSSTFIRARVNALSGGSTITVGINCRLGAAGGTTSTAIPAGNNTEIQFNSSGVLGASSSLTWDGTTLTATNLSTGTVTQTGDIALANGKALKGDSTTAHTWLLQGYDNNTGPGYVTFATITNGNTPSFVLTPPSGGGTITVNASTLQQSGSTITLAGALTTSGANALTLTTTGTTNVTLPTSGTLAPTSSKLSAFASTSSSELAGVISDETGSGLLVFATSPTFTTPILGVATATSVTSRYISNGSAPAVAGTTMDSCGTNAPTIVGNDNAFKVTVGAMGGTSCTVTFQTAFSAAPSCSASNETTANLLRAISTTTTVILAGTMQEADVLAGVCMGR